MTTDVCQVFARAPKTGLLFERASGGPHRSYSAANEAIKRCCRRGGLRPIGWHALRHTFASHLVGAGVHLMYVQQLLGHASIMTTMRYAHLAPSALRGAIDTLESFVATRRIPNSGPQWAQLN
jgi:site-specific recombinase XerD